MQESSDVNLFQPEQREVTLLFADMRGFTELAAALQTDPLVCELLAHVMDCLSDAVARFEGFIIDFYGDGLAAMWNAPSHQPDHADRACHTALHMLDSLPEVSHEWGNITHSPLRLGVGVHTGIVQVGNAGSARKPKYGPRGPNVNLVSRVEAATKELGVPFVATRSTIDQLSPQFVSNRACRAKVPGVHESIDLFAVQHAPIDAHLESAWQGYSDALARFERGEYHSAAESLSLIDASIGEVPVRFLAERVRSEMGRRLRRRNSDTPMALPNGVIPLITK